MDENKQYQPYSFGDEDANPIIIPNSNKFSQQRALSSKTTTSTSLPMASTVAAAGTSTKNWHLPSRNNTSNSTPSFGIIPKSGNGNNNNNNQDIPHTVFEEDEDNEQPQMSNPLLRPPNPTHGSFYDGVQRFSATSLPDMMQERNNLRIVNPDDEYDDDSIKNEADDSYNVNTSTDNSDV